MKIRIKGNSVRYRLSMTDVRILTTEGHLEEQTFFGNSTFRYALARKEEGEALTAGYTDHRITAYIPAALLQDWAGNDVVGFDAHMPTDGGNSLYILVEKDFQCLDHTTEDQSDNYINPNRTC